MYVQQAAGHLCENYAESRFYYSPNEWPPYRPKHYTTLALIHHKGKRVNTEVISVAEGLVSEGNFSKTQPSSGKISYHSKDILELFPTNLVSSYFLLIEGAPGIGKTILSKEIAYQWAENKLLRAKKLVFLLFLRDPNIKNLLSLESLIQYLFKSTEIVSSLSNYLFQTKGKGLVIIFDGYDEMSEEDRNNSLVAKIISRDVLPKCDLVITSRPSASLYLRDVADCRVEVLGFTEEDRLDYIQHALGGSDDKIKALQHFLKSNCTINALCYVPLNMTILLCLFEEVDCLSRDLDNKEDNGLPNTQTEMYEKFILMTITRFIKKSNKSFSGKCLNFTDLPELYNKAFNEILYLAFNALTKDQIVFNLNDEIVESCPILKSGNCEGLGLLKVTEYVNNVSFHFLHFSIQECLAAYYIASQSSSFQVKLLRSTFWDIHYFNTWIMYVGMTRGKKEAWRHFISGNWFMLFTKVFKSSKISKKYLNDKIKSLHLFQCLAEIGNKELVGKVFKDKIIDLSNQTLLPRDVNTMCFFLLRSVNKHWIKLDLSRCNIGDTGSDILCKTFLDTSRNIININKVDLSHNQLHSHSILGLLDVFKVWHTSEAVSSGNYDNDINQFELCLNKFALCNDEDFPQIVVIGPLIFAYNIDIYNQLINPTNIVTALYLSHCICPSTNLTSEELSHKLILSKLHIIGENIHSIGAIFQTLKEVDSVYIYDHTLSDEDVNFVSSTLCKRNSSNLGIWVVIGKTKILGNIPDMFSLNKHFSPIEISNLTKSIKRLCSTSEMFTTKFNKCIESKTVCEDFFHVLHKSISKCEIKFCLLENNILIANGVKYDNLIKVLSSNNNLESIFITKCKLNVTELKIITKSIVHQESSEELYTFDSLIEMDGFNCENLLNQTLKVKQLFIHSTDLSCSLTFDLPEALRIYSNVSVLLITSNTLIGHNPTCEQMLLSLQLEANLTCWKICNFPINIELFQQHTLSNVVELDIIGCHIGEHDFQPFNNHYNHRISKQTIDSICRLLSYFTELKTFNLRHSNLREAGTGKIFKVLSILTKLNISHNDINEQAVNDIANLLSQTSKLEELDLSYNSLRVTEAVNLLNEVQNISSLSRLNISNNGLNDKVAHSIATLLSHNPQLKVLDLGYNNLQVAGTIVICKGMSNLLNLTKLNFSNNNISGEAANDIAVVLSQNKSLEELDFSYNCLGAIDSWHIIRNMIKMSDLIKLNICGIGITEIAADDIATVLNNNNKLEELDLSHNNIKTVGTTIIFKKASTVNLHKFNINHNNITGDVDYIEGFLSTNTNLEELDLSHNNLQAAGAIKVCKTNLTKLTSFNISHNNIAFDATNDIGTFLSHNTKLQILDISGNNIQELGYIFKSVLSNLTSLNISHSGVINEAADELATFLLQNTSLQGIDLSYSNLSTSSAVKIFKGMKNTSNLKIINISHNMIKDEAADMLANVLLNNIKLKDIDLSCTNLSTLSTINIFKGMKNISNLEKINISHNTITDEAAKNIANVLSHNHKLQSLDLSSDHIKYEGLFEIFYCLQNAMYLRKLNISCNKITATNANIIATVLSHNLKLEELNLGNNLMQTASTVTIFKSLRQNSNLKKLYINDNMITDAAADDIAVVLSQNVLEELDISCNNLQTAGIIKIFGSMKHISTLTKLNIAHNNVTDEATKYIVDGLSSNSNLKELNLSHINLKNTIGYKNLKLTNLNKFNFSSNNIDEQSANEISLFLSHCINLKVLDLSCANLQNSGCIQIFNRLNIFSLTTFNISGNSIMTRAADTIAVLLFKNHELEKLDLSCNNLQESGIKHILMKINISNLSILNISSNHISNLKYIGDVLTHATKLVELDLSHNTLSAGSMRYFLYRLKSIFANLVKLKVSGNIISAEVTEALADVLLENTKLQELDLSDNNLHGESVRNIFNGLKISTLIKFNISHNKITHLAARYIAIFLSRNTKLEELDLSHNQLLSAGAIKICWMSLTNLTNFNISHNGITAQAANEIAAFLSHNAKLQVLDLSSNRLEESCCLKVLQHTFMLSSLKISDCNVISETAGELATVLLHSTFLQELDLSYNSLSKLDSLKILKGMKNISSLVTINVSHNKITDEAAEELATVLLCNTKLEKLDLSFNDLSTTDIVKIFKGMENILNLKEINIGYNMITDYAADSIATVLSHNSKLETFDMSSNYLGSKGCTKIFNGMRNVIYLRNLVISHNKITAEATVSIAAVLSHNTKLKQLDISYNDLQTPGAIQIFQGIKHTSTLTKLNIAHNMITDEVTEYIINILHNNTELKELNLSDNTLLEVDVILVSNVSKLVNNQAIITNLQQLKFNIELRRVGLGVIKIFKELVYYCTLTKVNISGYSIHQSGAYNLAIILSKNNDLQELDMSYNNLQTEGIKIILRAIRFSNLTKLNISANSADLIVIVKVLSQATKLEELDLSYNKLNNSDVKRFFTISRNIFVNLIKLNISGIFHEISDEAAADLAYIFSQNNKLNELDLSNNNLYPEAASIILNGLNASGLIKFRISHNNISDRAAVDIATFLCKCFNLQELDLSYNSLQDTGATEICRANISTLISFNISHNNITIKAADDVANFLSYNSQMQTFDLSSNGLLEVGVRNILKDMQVVQSLFNLSELNISNGSVINETIRQLINILLCNTELKQVDLSFNSLFVSDAVKILQGMKNISNLVTIDLSYNNITDEAADELATVLLHNTSLQSIDLSYNNLSTSDAIQIFKGMKNISKLEIVNISHNMITNEAADELATVLSHNNSLQIFDMSSNYFSSEGCIKIMNGMSNILYLKKIDISCNQITYKATDSIATFLSHNSELEEFILSCNDFQKSYLFKKMESVKLTKLDVSFALPEVDDIATVLMHNSKLEDINLSNNELLPNGIKRICLKMKKILNLKRIDISHNRITWKAADDLANVLSQNINLQELYLSNTNLRSDGIVTLFNRMSNISKLTHLDISSNKITDEAGDDIAGFLLHNSNLNVLELSNNLIQAAGTRIIFGKGKTDISLKKLNLCGNALDDEAADIMAAFLSRNPSLEEFNISKNYLQALGAVKIFRAIQESPNILKLDMSNNKITDEAADEIAAVLSTVTKLREVDLDCNLLSAEMSDYIKRAFIKLRYYEL